MSGCSSGPVRTMPGYTTNAQAGDQCDEIGCSKPAEWSVQGETDSMGCEYINLCDAHHLEHVAAMRNFKNPGRCDWCKQEVDERRSRRDYDEGMSGPVYDVCRPCIAKDNELARQDREDSEEW